MSFSIDYTTYLQKEWTTLLQFGAWIASLVASILISPQLYEFDDFDWYWKLLNFFAAAVSSLLLFLMLKLSNPKYANRWWLISLLFFILSFGSIAFYTNDHFDYTTPYADTYTAVGNYGDLKDNAKHNVERLNEEYGRTLTIREIVQKAGGNTESLWEPEMLNQRRKLLIFEFAAIFFFIIPFVLSVTQAIKLAYHNRVSLDRSEN